MQDRPRHRALFSLGLVAVALWLPVTFGAVALYTLGWRPLMIAVWIWPHDVVTAFLVLLLWGLPGVPALLLGYYGWRRPAPLPSH